MAQGSGEFWKGIRTAALSLPQIAQSTPQPQPAKQNLCKSFFSLVQIRGGMSNNLDNPHLSFGTVTRAACESPFQIRDLSGPTAPNSTKRYAHLLVVLYSVKLLRGCWNAPTLHRLAVDASISRLLVYDCATPVCGAALAPVGRSCLIRILVRGMLVKAKSR